VLAIRCMSSMLLYPSALAVICAMRHVCVCVCVSVCVCVCVCVCVSVRLLSLVLSSARGVTGLPAFPRAHRLY
jgi:hypothetical protein